MVSSALLNIAPSLQALPTAPESEAGRCEDAGMEASHAITLTARARAREHTSPAFVLDSLQRTRPRRPSYKMKHAIAHWHGPRI
ncbi:hypothetical protein C8Q74DRAFT_1364140 [Fomes fomentarius]|nr:hypothetical protein C8Q74DRAFT_1364140 [Fomes fomentarius]